MSEFREKAKALEAELLPCAFCGGEAMVIDNGATDLYTLIHQCRNEQGEYTELAVSGSGWTTRAKLKKAWNYRAQKEATITINPPTYPPRRY